MLRAIDALTDLRPNETLLDVGCGEGFYAGSLSESRKPLRTLGIDISIPAIDLAARRYPQCDWVVANADRFLPCAPHAFSVVMSITARMQPAEFARALKGDGRLLIALPAPDDLIELRGNGRDRVPRTVEEFSPHFRLVRSQRVSTSADLDAAGVQDVLVSIYRPLHLESAQPRRITFSLDLLVFEPT